MKVKWKKVLTHLGIAVFCIGILYSLNVLSVNAIVRSADRGFNVPATWTEGDSKITLPGAPEGWKVELFGSDRKEVIALDGTVTRPLEDVDVNLLYKLTNTTSNEVIETNVNTQLHITKKIPDGFVTGTNAKPKVLPVLREWAGGEGKIKIQNGTTILVDSATYRQSDAAHKKANLEKLDNFYTQVNSFKDDLKELMGIDAEIVVDGTPKSGDIYFTATGAPTTLGKEGYQIEIGTSQDIVIVRAPQKVGTLYGGISILQILKQNDGELPKGIVRDYPEFEERGYMLDVARTFLPIEYLNDTMKQMSWYKMNLFSLHLSDNEIWDNLTLGQEMYAAFRLESDVPGLTAKDGYYTKDEFRTLQYDGNDLGVMVVPELDTPGHALAYTRVWPDISRTDSGKYLDVTKPETAERIKKLFDEYTLPYDGKEEAFILPQVNIGTDEYKNGDKEAFRKYTDTLLKHVKASGKEPYLWGSLTENAGTTPVMSDATMFAWYKGYANPKQSLEDGFRIISMEDQEVYVIPGGGYYNNQYGRGEYLYNSWLPNNNSGWSNSPAPLGHPRAVGGQFAVWNDWVGNGISTGDISFRAQYNMQSIAQKSWAGDENEGSYADFKALGQCLGDAPNADFLYTDEVYEDNKVVDLSSKDDIATNTGAKLTDQNVTVDTGRFGDGIRFNGGNSHIDTDLTSTGFDWTVGMWINPDSDNPQDAVLMEGKTGTLKLKQGKTNKLGYSVDHLFDESGKPTVDKFNHDFHYEIPSNQWTHIALSGDAYGVKLYVNGIFVDELKGKPFPNYNPNSGAYGIGAGQTANYYETLMLPTATIGSQTNAFKGVIDDLQIYNRVLSENEVALLSKIPGLTLPKNLALNASVTASGNEVASKWQHTAVVDGVRTGDSRWSSNYSDSAWLTVDLGSVQSISQIDIYWEAAYAIKYKILISENGTDWDEVLDVPADGDGGSPKRIVFPATNARYIKFQGVERKVIGGGKWGYSMYEIEVFALPSDLSKPGLIKLLNDSSILYHSVLPYLNDELNTSYKALLDEANAAIIGDLSNEKITEYINDLTTENAKLSEVKTVKEAMIKVRDSLEVYVDENQKRLSQESIDRAKLLIEQAGENLINRDDVSQTTALTTELTNMLTIITDEVTNANVVKGATVTTNAELWPGFSLNNLVDGNLNTRLAYKRTANPITIDIQLSDAQKSKPWNQLVLHEVVGGIEGGEIVNAEIVAYDLQIKQADGTYLSVQKVDRTADSMGVCGPILSIELDKNVSTDAIRFIVTPRNASAGVNISELEVYNEKKSEESDTSIRGIVQHLQIPAISERATVELPTVPSNYSVRIAQSSQPSLIALDGTLSLPTKDTQVTLVMEVSKIVGNKTTECSTFPYTIEVPAGASAEEKAALQISLTEAKALSSSDYSSSSWARVQTAIDNAETLVAKANIFTTNMTTVKQALETAKTGLVNLTELQKRVNDFTKLDENDYLSTSYQAYKTLLDEKKLLLTKSDVTSQEILNACQALDSLELIAKGNPKDLQDLVDGYTADKTLVEVNFTKNSWQAYKTVYDNAKALLLTGQYTQEQLSEMQTQLTTTHTNLVSVVVAKATLEAYGDKDLTAYTPNTKKLYSDAITALRYLVTKDDVSKTDLATAVQDILEANLKLVEQADMDQLKKAVDDYKVIIADKEFYIKATYENFEKAYQVIVTMADDENTSQSDAKNALDALLKAKTELIRMILLEEDNVIVETDDKAIPVGTKLIVNKVSDQVNADVRQTLASIGKKVQIYDLSLQFNGSDVTLQKPVKVKLAIPDGFDTSKLALYYVNGTHKEELLLTIEDGYVVFMTDHFSIYTIVEKDEKVDPNPGPSTDPETPSTKPSNPSTPDQDKPGNGITTSDDSMIGLYSLGLLCAVGTITVLKKRKENNL